MCVCEKTDWHVEKLLFKGEMKGFLGCKGRGEGEEEEGRGLKEYEYDYEREADCYTWLGGKSPELLVRRGAKMIGHGRCRGVRGGDYWRVQ